MSLKLPMIAVWLHLKLMNGLIARTWKVVYICFSPRLQTIGENRLPPVFLCLKKASRIVFVWVNFVMPVTCICFRSGSAGPIIIR